MLNAKSVLGFLAITDGDTWIPYSNVSSEPEEGRYTLAGTTNEMVRLIITSKVTATGTTTGARTFYNSATLDWEGKPDGVNPGTGNIGVGIGYNAISKTGVLNKALREITWTVNVDAKGQSIPDMKVYDLLIYDDGVELDTAAGIPAGIDFKDLTPRHGLKFEADSYTGAGTLNVIAIEQDGKRIGDLLEITGLSTSTVNSFSFDTLVVDPDIFAGNKMSEVHNTASLFTGTDQLNEATGTVNYDSRTLEKELLDREGHADPAAGVNIHRTTQAADGFDYIDKSVIFRLSINADGLDFNALRNSDGEALGTATVTDTLPSGWEFTDIMPGEKYLVFEGTAGNGSSVNASDTEPDNVAGLSSDFTQTGKATFTFSPLDKPYVILVKAKPTEPVLEAYFDSNKTSTITNQLGLTAEKWVTGVSRTRNVSIKSELLKKTYTVPMQGALNWTVDYNPYDLNSDEGEIKDTLPIGLDLRTDSKGVLLLDGNITAKELTLHVDGTLEEGNPVPLIQGDNVIYDNTTRVLTFSIPDSSKAYRFTYLTDITGDPGAVTNQVQLSRGSVNEEYQAVNYAISSADSLATMQRGGWLELTKTNGSTSAALPGAEFTLFSEDGGTVIRKAVSTANGKLTIRAIPEGNYVLKETAAPSGYTLENVERTVSVDTSGPTVITSIEGQTGNGSNLLTVENYIANTVGQLAISKTVAGNDGDLNKKFDFTVTFTGAPGTYSYIGTGGASNGTISSGGTIALAHGECVIITGLPKDAEYTVTEADYSSEGYIAASFDASGIIVADDTQTAAFTNTKDKPGSLVISKTVAGNAGDRSKKFDFTITFDATGSYNYTGAGGAADGTIRSGDSVSLAHGESITISGLPKDTAYAVSEANYSTEGYTTASSGDSATIVTDAVQTASFVNTKNVYVSPGPGPGPSDPGTPSETGSLTVEKTVTGDAGDRGKKFDFTIVFDGAAGFYSYSGSGGNGMLQSGSTVTLAHGERITISGLPKGASYTVSEADYSSEGYSSVSTGASGLILGNAVQSASFVNTKNSAESEQPSPEEAEPGDNGSDDGFGGDGDGDTVSGEGYTGNDETGNFGGNVGSKGGSQSGTPKTGDDSLQQVARIGLIFFLLALAGLFWRDSVLRRRSSKD